MGFSLTVCKTAHSHLHSENESRAAANLTGFRRVTHTSNLHGPEHVKYMKLSAGKTAYMTHQALWELTRKWHKEQRF